MRVTPDQVHEGDSVLAIEVNGQNYFVGLANSDPSDWEEEIPEQCTGCGLPGIPRISHSYVCIRRDVDGIMWDGCGQHYYPELMSEKVVVFPWW